MNLTSSRKRLATLGIAAGVVLGSAGVVSAVTGTTPDATTPDSVPAAAPAAGVDTSNSDPTHEAGESAEREAAETAGGGRDHGAGDGHHHSNTDAAHEASESPERQAQEAADDAALGSTTNSTATTIGG
jgi:hypothetical protein